MAKISKSVLHALWIFSICIVVLGTGIFLYVHHLRAALNQELTTYLSEVAQQGVRILNTQIKGDLSSLQSAAAAISTYKTLDNKPWTELLQEETRQNEFKRMGFILPNGVAYLSDGFMLDLAHREYFKEGLAGKTTVTDPLTDAVDQGKAIILSVPVISGDTVRGVLIAAHPTAMYGNLIASDSFNGAGYSLIVKANGDKVASSAKSNIDDSVANIFQSKKNTRLDPNGTMRKNMQQGKSGTVRFFREGEGWLYLSYVPVGLNDWYFLSVVPEKVAVQKTKNLLRLSLLLFGTGLAVFIALLIYVYKQNKYSHAILYKAAYIDPILTCPNWAKTSKEIEDVLRQTQGVSYAFVVFDINKFKVANDRLGYGKANELLQYIAKVVKDELKDGELFCRVQGDIFALLLIMETPEQLKNRLEVMNEKIVNFHPIEKDKFQLMLSFGVYPVMDTSLSAGELFLRAVLARDTVKGNYNDIVAFYDEKLRQRLSQEQNIENNMEEALLKKEFSLELSPIRSIDGSVAAAEAVPVWQQGPEQNTIPTDLFLSVFNKNGFIARLDTYLAEEACRILQQWKGQNLPAVPIILNISAASLRSPYFSSVLLQLTKQYEVSASSLILQLTPHTAPEDLPLFKQLAIKLHNAGFKLSLNHFGRGTVSLDLLQALPLDIVKMEGIFIQDLNTNPRTAAVLSAFIEMAASLNLHLIFDGVKENTQLQQLKQLGALWWAGPLAGEALSPEKLFASNQNRPSH